MGAQQFTVGNAQLSAEQMSSMYSIPVSTIRARIGRGVRGEALVKEPAAVAPSAHKIKHYDCGSHGRLTASEIAAIAGVRPATIQRRARDGIRGEALAAPAKPCCERKKSTDYREHVGSGLLAGGGAVELAVRIARIFPKEAPSVSWLMDHCGMSRSNAYRWRRAFLDAMGAP